MTKVYAYKNCDTCRKALKFLEARRVAHEVLPIRETPPSRAELKKMLQFLGGDVRRLLNTSGQDYRQLNLKEKLPTLSPEKIIELLSTNGNLIKRPFVISGDRGLTGFKEEEWKKIF